MSIRYIADRHLPDKAIDLMDEASSRVQLTGITVPPQLKEVEQNLHALAEKKEEAIREAIFQERRELAGRTNTWKKKGWRKINVGN